MKTNVLDSWYDIGVKSQGQIYLKYDFELFWHLMGGVHVNDMLITVRTIPAADNSEINWEC